MFHWERTICRTASQVVAVSEVDERTMRSRFGVESISSVPTGVDLAYFERPSAAVRARSGVCRIHGLDAEY